MSSFTVVTNGLKKITRTFLLVQTGARWPLPGSEWRSQRGGVPLQTTRRWLTDGRTDGPTSTS